MQLSWENLVPAPAQYWRGIRLVPMLRRQVHDDLRLARPNGNDHDCCTFLPHGQIAAFEDDGSVQVFFGSSLGKRSRSRPGALVQLFPRLPRRRKGHRPWFLPTHMTFEGMVCLHFGAPDIAWAAYSRQALIGGVSARVDDLVAGRQVRHLDEALQVFEIHDDQVGVMIFLGEQLASAFVVPHPDDYRSLHRSLLRDLYAETFLNGLRFAPAQEWLNLRIDGSGVKSVADLRCELARVHAQWTSFHEYMSAGLFQANLIGERIQRQRPFELYQFVTDLVPRQENYLGEAIVRDDGSLEYLSTFRLSKTSTKRLYLLQQLACHGWNFTALVSSVATTDDELMLRFKKAGFAYLFDEHVLAAAVKKARHRRRHR